jgi:hypothetical protein
MPQFVFVTSTTRYTSSLYAIAIEQIVDVVWNANVPVAFDETVPGIRVTMSVNDGEHSRQHDFQDTDPGVPALRSAIQMRAINKPSALESDTVSMENARPFIDKLSVDA